MNVAIYDLEQASAVSEMSRFVAPHSHSIVPGGLLVTS